MNATTIPTAEAYVDLSTLELVGALPAPSLPVLPFDLAALTVDLAEPTNAEIEHLTVLAAFDDATGCGAPTSTLPLVCKSCQGPVKPTLFNGNRCQNPRCLVGSHYAAQCRRCRASFAFCAC